MARLQMNVLGPFEALSQDGTPVSLTTRKAQALLAILALEGRGASRDRIAHLLWGERDEERARHNVRQTLSKIKHACGDIVKSNRDLLTLDPATCSVDVNEFERLVLNEDEASLARSLDIYSGDLLQGLLPRETEFQNWLLQTREQLQSKACDAMDRLVQILMSSDRFELAIERLGHRLKLDPACEHAHRNLMDLLARTGRRSDALRQYNACKEALQRELAAEPSPDTNALYNKILNVGSDNEKADLQHPLHALITDTDKPKVAVLPFENLTSEKDDYFADGMTEDIITALSRFHSLHVIARGSTFIYKGQDTPDPEIAEALGAQFLVHGSVQRAGDRIRLNVQLLDGPKGLNIWAHRFDRELTDVFLVQDEITATVVSTLAGRVEATQLARARQAPTERLDAYDYYLRGKDHHHRFNAEDCAMCIEMFGHAIERDPTYAVAHAWLACGLGQAMVFDLDDHAKLVDRSQKAAERGLELDENESECHRILAQVHLIRSNLARALRHQERALFLNPNDDRSVCSMGEILTFAGRAEEAEPWVRKSMSLNPYHPQRYWTHLAHALLHLERFEEALEVLEQIGRPRRDDLAYAVVCSVRSQDVMAIRSRVDTLCVAFPDFSATGFVDALPYQRTEERRTILDALVGANL